MINLNNSFFEEVEMVQMNDFDSSSFVGSIHKVEPKIIIEGFNNGFPSGYVDLLIVKYSSEYGGLLILGGFQLKFNSMFRLQPIIDNWKNIVANAQELAKAGYSIEEPARLDLHQYSWMKIGRAHV